MGQVQVETDILHAVVFADGSTMLVTHGPLAAPRCEWCGPLREALAPVRDLATDLVARIATWSCADATALQTQEWIHEARAIRAAAGVAS